jgi:Holliday junction resolvase RusA-like endonuclease
MTPIPWTRPRLHGRVFFDGQQKQKTCYGLYLLQQHNDEPLFKDKPLSIDITFYMFIPESSRKKNKLYHASIPDLDNLCKFALDSLRGVVLADDRFICSLVARKLYDKNPRTEFTITELE